MASRYAWTLEDAMLWLLLACGDEASESSGPRKALGEGEVWAFAETDMDGLVTRLGVALTPDALEGLPAVATEVLLALPEGIDLAPFDHVGLNWEPDGHDPLAVWDEPHFDLHMFMVGEAERAEIDSDDDRIVAEPPADTIPPGYAVAPTSAVAGQGIHWLDPSTEEWTGGPFTASLLFGSWDARWVFLEPMVTWETLASSPDLVVDVVWPERWQSAGRYPRIVSVAETDETIQVMLDELEGE